ncbi:MAG: hypothetical protein J6Q38_04830 [Clostridia bacterium]|nr:hypothetical protein [Clostridia bacterium]
MNNEIKAVPQNEDSTNARLRAKIITTAAKEQYDTEIGKLKLFIERFNNYMNDVVKTYPSDMTRKTVAVGQMIKDILHREESLEYTEKNKIADIYKLLDGAKPQKKGLYGESENGFNLDDVLNPKEHLDLDSLLKELGVKK